MQIWDLLSDSNAIYSVLRLTSRTLPTFCTLLSPVRTLTIITARKRSLGQGNIFTPVCHSVHGGEYLTRYPLPGTRCPPPGHQVHPPDTRYTPPGPQVHPPPCEIRSTCGRYASYWNAILFMNSAVKARTPLETTTEFSTWKLKLLCHN